MLFCFLLYKLHNWVSVLFTTYSFVYLFIYFAYLFYCLIFYYFFYCFLLLFFSILFYSIATQDTSRNASFLVVQLSLLMTRVRALSVECRQWQNRCPECKYLFPSNVYTYKFLWSLFQLGTLNCVYISNVCWLYFHTIAT